MSSIAHAHGFFWETLWSDADNEELRSERESPFVLEAGDIVSIPPLRQRKETCQTGVRHTFRRKGVPAKLSLQLCVGGEPLAEVGYILEHSGQEFLGATDAQGHVEVYIPPYTPKAILRVGDRVYDVTPRSLDPAETIRGAQARLANLGYYHGKVHGKLDTLTGLAIRRLQADHELDVTGELDDPTISALKTAYAAER
ncbi:peptidoglycan-binding domain-containing protein [Enhygromyxa salina]|nr:peptidoglycan-binding domain-containing protein [Enhygromyxa salina]